MEELVYITYVLYPILCIVRYIILILVLNSTYSANLARIGLRISWSSGKPTSLHTNYHWLLKVILFSIIDIVMWLLAPLGVLFQIVYWVYQLLNVNGAPANIKAIAWRIRNIPMSKEQLEYELQQYNQQR